MPKTITCPACQSANIVFEEIRRTLTQYDVLSSEEGDDESKFVLVSSKARATIGLDSMGNEDRFCCLDCSHTWELDYDEYDEVVQEEVSEEDQCLDDAIELLREAADACSAADPEPKNAILSLAEQLAGDLEE
jgi:hypothetical protein